MALNSPHVLSPIDEQNFLLIYGLEDQAALEGHAFIARTIDDWNTGRNKFSAPGEGLWGLRCGSELIGLGGLNRDPYTPEPGIGRLRHLYIRQAYRRQGCATSFLQHIVSHAAQHFHCIRLYTDNPAAARCYEKFGFERCQADKASHILQLT